MIKSTLKPSATVVCDGDRLRLSPKTGSKGPVLSGHLLRVVLKVWQFDTAREGMKTETRRHRPTTAGGWHGWCRERARAPSTASTAHLLELARPPATPGHRPAPRQRADSTHGRAQATNCYYRSTGNQVLQHKSTDAGAERAAQNVTNTSQINWEKDLNKRGAIPWSRVTRFNTAREAMLPKWIYGCNGIAVAAPATAFTHALVLSSQGKARGPG